MTQPTPHVSKHLEHMREHMAHARLEAERIQQLADAYIADQQPPTPTVEVDPSRSQPTDSTPASS